MKILYHHRTQGEEPESIHITSIVSALRTLGHEVVIVGPSKKELGSVGTNVKYLSLIKYHSPKFIFELLQIGYNIISYRKLRQAIKEFGPDFIYERYALYDFSGVWAAKKFTTPLILEVNTPYAYAWSKYYRVYFPNLARRIEQRILNAASRVITVTGVQKKFLGECHHVDLGRISVSHNAINPSNFSPPSKSNQEANNELINTPITVGFVGTMNRWQGIPVFKDVIPRVLTERNNVIFLMVGDGEYRNDLEKIIESKGLTDRVTFTGRVEHARIPELVQKMDITLLPDSNKYGSPMKIFEYMAMGKAMVVPRVGPVEEVVEKDVTGLIIDPGNVDSMVSATLKLVDSEQLRLELGGKAREYVISNHTWIQNAKTIIDIYQNIVASQNS